MTRVFCRILPIDHARFLVLLATDHDFPISYAAWEREYTERLARAGAEGHTIVEQIVQPREFSEWLKCNDRKPSLKMLEAFAAEKHNAI